MVDESNAARQVEAARNTDDVIQYVPKARKVFTPELPVADLDCPLLKGKPIDKRDLMMAINLTRLGVNTLVVSVTYEIQVGDDLRTPPTDFVEVTGVSPKLHIGAMTTATFNKDKQFYIRLADTLRSNGLDTGYTSMRVSGITSFKILQMFAGPVFWKNNVPG